MKIKQTKRIEQEIEIKLPFFSKDKYTFYKCTENGLYTINTSMLAFTDKDSFFFEEKVSEVYELQHISEDEFNIQLESTKLLFNGK